MTYQAKQYAHALFALLPATQKDFEAALSTLKAFKRGYETDAGIRSFFDDPNRPIKIKQSAIEAALRDALTPVRNLLILMTENFDLFKLSKTIYILKKIGDAQYDILEIRVRTATPLTDALTQKLREKFQEHTDQTVLIREKVDEALIAGFSVRIRDRLIDARLSTSLAHLLLQKS